MEKLSHILSQFGLNDKESALYLASLDLGPAAALAIARRAGIQRTHFYDLSQRLVAVGLLKQAVRGKKRLFVATDPEYLLEIQEHRLEQLKKSIPEFKALYNVAGQKPKVFFYEGAAGIEYVNEDTLKYGGEIVGFTTPRFVAGASKRTGDAFIRERVARGIRARVIGEDAPEIKKLQTRDGKELRETRILSSDVFRSNIEMGVYGSRVAIVDYREQWGLIIEGQEIANVVKMLFEIVWSKWG